MERMLLQFCLCSNNNNDDDFVAASSSTPYPANAQTDNNSIQIISEADLMGPATRLTVLIADGSLDAITQTGLTNTGQKMIACDLFD